MQHDSPHKSEISTELQIRDNFTSKSRQLVQAIFYVRRTWMNCRCFSGFQRAHVLQIMNDHDMSGNVLQVCMPGPVTWSVAETCSDNLTFLHSPCNGAQAGEGHWISMVFIDHQEISGAPCTVHHSIRGLACPICRTAITRVLRVFYPELLQGFKVSQIWRNLEKLG